MTNGYNPNEEEKEQNLGSDQGDFEMGEASSPEDGGTSPPSEESNSPPNQETGAFNNFETPSEPPSGQAGKQVPQRTGGTEVPPKTPEPFKVPTEPQIQKEEPDFETKVFGEGKREERIKEKDFEVPRRGGGKRIILIFTSLIIIILAALVIFNEYGILNIGLERIYGQIYLEKLWGGLGKDASSALKISSEAMGTVESFRMEGEFDMGGKADLAMIGKDNNKRTKQILGENIENFSLSGNLLLDTASDDFEGTAEISIISSETLKNIIRESTLSIYFKKISKNFYFRVPVLSALVGSDNNKWIKLEQKETASSDNFRLIINDASDAFVSGKRIGWDKVGKVPVYIYEVSLDGSKIAESIGLESTSADNSTAKLYLGKRDHRVHRILYRMTGSRGATSTFDIRFDSTLTKFNQAVTVTVPSEEEISSEGTIELLNLLTSVNTPEGRDAKRKEDLKKISDALEDYKDATGSYPNTNDTLSKTNDLSSVLAQALVSTYIAEIPKDPEDPDYYYGYKSDGSSYALSSILENKNDSEGTNVYGVFLYILQNSN